jgi:hypothetical protein
MIEKIYSMTEKILSVSTTVVFTIQKIFSVIETTFFIVKTTVSATEKIFSIAEKTVGEATALLVAVTNELAKTNLKGGLLCLQRFALRMDF